MAHLEKILPRMHTAHRWSFSMKKLALGCLALSLGLTSGCFGLSSHGIDSRHAASAAGNLLKAATVSDAELQAASAQLRQSEDRKYTVASASSKYTKRLQRITERLTSVNGIPLTYKVYMTKDINANACPDGSVRVFSGLMDIMTDDELRFVLGHEIGHVALGHSKDKMQKAYTVAAARDAAGVYTKVGVYSDSMLGDLAVKFLNAQFSQSDELEADKYGVEFLMKNNYPTDAALTAMSKLQGSGGFFSTHPSSAERIQKLQQAIAASKQ